MAIARPKPPRQRTGVNLAGAVDGSNVTFTFPEPALDTVDGPGPAIYYNGQRLVVTDDYALGGWTGMAWSTVVLLVVPRTGDKVTADYATT